VSLPVIILAWYSAVATVLVLGLALWARIDRRTIRNLYDRVDQQAEELAAWRQEAAEIEDESEGARFDAALQALCAAEDERMAERIEAAIRHAASLNAIPAMWGPPWGGFPLSELRGLIFRELQNGRVRLPIDQEVA